MKIIHVPLELIENRYSEQWFRWFNQHDLFKKHVVDTIIPASGISQTIEVGEFLDVIKTNHFKAEQLQEIMQLFHDKKVDEETIFFFMDGWFPGIEMLAYVRDALKIPFKIVAILHAGTWDSYDYISRCGMKRWARWIEAGWHEIFDAVFVGSFFHKNLILDQLGFKYADKIHITGLPIYPEFVWTQEDKNLNDKEFNILFPSRIAPEKNPQHFDKLIEILQPTLPKWKFIKTQEFCKSKSEYYALLNRSSIAVSFSDQETFGIAMMEATLCGCIPLLPNRLAYPEFYPKEFLIHNGFNPFKTKTVDDEIVQMAGSIISVIRYKEEYEKVLTYTQNFLLYRGKSAITNMLRICKSLI